MPYVRKPDPPTYPHADHLLTAAEVREHYGDLLDRFYAAMHQDPHFVADLGIAILKGCEKRDRGSRTRSPRPAGEGRARERCSALTRVTSLTIAHSVVRISERDQSRVQAEDAVTA